jgi:signal transduction histidine kinase
MVDKSRSRINGGSGIGLSLVKKILLLHSSSIKIESIENEGTTVYFELEEVQE